MFSLNKFRKIKNNCYNSKNNCNKQSFGWKKKNNSKSKLTNPRFKLFDQLYFTAGDFKDINKYALLPIRYYDSELNKMNLSKESGDKELFSGTIVEENTMNLSKENTNKKLFSEVSMKENTINSIHKKKHKYINEYFKLYNNIDYISVYNSFKYIFDKFKKGIFVMIRNNKLVIYMPFSNVHYKNNWEKFIYFSSEEKKLLEDNNYNKIKHILNRNIIEFQKKYPEQFRGRKINFNRSSWYANNCIFRNEFPMYEGELNTNIYKNMIDELLKERTIPDIEFFINDRDFPILKKDLTEPYHHIFDSDSIKIEKEYIVDKMCPIFSQSITNDFADLLIPTNDEWKMASNKFFTSGCGNEYKKESIDKWNYDWKSKIGKCIFRGGATGCGTRIDNNMRLKACDLSVDRPDILDAGIVDWKARMRKVKDEPMHIIDTNKLRFKLKNKINNIEKSNYKYILYIDGYVSAYRLASELSMNSCILIVKSPYKMWFSDLLVEYKHYIPIKHDLQDLIPQIEWCIKNDKKCEKIANNAKKFYEKYLTKDGLFNYLESIFYKIYENKNLKNPLCLTIPKSEMKKKVALITIFREDSNSEKERTRELKLFIKLMNKLLIPYCQFHIYIIEQSDDGELFNIGKLKNIGFNIAKKEYSYDNYIFSDIDIIPDYDLIKYYSKKLKYPISLALRGTRYMNNNLVDKKIFMGSLLGFSSTQFEKINGYPNNFWGWGGEDEAIKGRLVNSGMNTFYYPSKGSIIDLEETKDMKTINNVNNKLKIVKKEEVKYEKLVQDLSTWNENGLNNLEYKILSKNKINNNTTQIKVDLMKKDEYIQYSNNYKKLINIFKNTVNKLKYEFI
jgi:hypothetical protein